MKKIFWTFAATVLSAFLAVGYVAAAPEVIELRVVTIYPVTHQSMNAFYMLRDRVNERAKGELVIKRIGGPETIGMFDQAKAVSAGVADMAFLFSAAYAGLVPGENLLSVSRLPYGKEREVGFHDLMNEIHNKAGLYFLGRGATGYGHKEPRKWHLWVNKKIEGPNDLAGMKIGAISPAMNNFLKALKASPVVLTPTDLYAALERGVVDGQVNPMGSFLSMSGMEVCKYYVDVRYATDNNVFIVNLKTWNQLPEQMRKLLTDISIEVERDYPPIQSAFIEQSLQKMKDAGIEFIKFSPDEREHFVNLFYEAEWEAMLNKYPEVAPRARKMLLE